MPTLDYPAPVASPARAAAVSVTSAGSGAESSRDMPALLSESYAVPPLYDSASEQPTPHDSSIDMDTSMDEANSSYLSLLQDPPYPVSAASGHAAKVCTRSVLSSERTFKILRKFIVD